MAIQYALLSLGTGVISNSQVHDTFHTVHTYIYIYTHVFMHKCIASSYSYSGVDAFACVHMCMCVRIGTRNII